MDRIFLRPQYVVHFRTAHRIPFRIALPSEYVALFPQRAPCSVEVDGRELTLRPSGDALLINPGPDEILVHGKQSAPYLLLSMSPSFVLDCAIRSRLAHGGNSLVVFRSPLVESDRKLERAANDLADELQQEEEAAAGQDMIIAALIEQILIRLLRAYSNARRSDHLELSRAGLVDRRIRRAIELMHACLEEELPLEEIAAAAYLSPFHFARLFKKLTGATPHAYLAALRTNRARTLLAETDLSITEISARVGYASPSHFTKAFRQTAGLTPRDFRNALVKSRC